MNKCTKKHIQHNKRNYQQTEEEEEMYATKC